MGVFIALFLLGPMISAVNAQNTDPGPPDTTGSPTDPGQGPGGEPQQHKEGGTVWVNTDIITIMANEIHPSFHFWYTADENGTMARFMVSYTTLIEFEDANDDAAYQLDELLYFAPLAAYEWTLQTGSVEENGVTTEVWLKYTKAGAIDGGMKEGAPEGPMPGQGSIPRFEDVTIQIWAHIYTQDYEGNVTDDHGVGYNYTVAGGAEMKMDIEIGNFPFSTNTSSVALQTMLKENEATGIHEPKRHQYVTRERSRNVTGNSNANWTTPSGNESQFQNMNGTHTQQVDFVDTTTEEAQGFFSWLDTAVITWPGGETEAVNVTASYVPTGVGLAVYLAYPNFDDGTLLHDPSIGLIEDASPIDESPFDLTLLLGIGIVAVLAIIVVVAIKKR
jgi:hypothetical protein